MLEAQGLLEEEPGFVPMEAQRSLAPASSEVFSEPELGRLDARSGAPAPMVPTESGSPAGERKLATVLFADLVGRPIWPSRTPSAPARFWTASTTPWPRRSRAPAVPSRSSSAMP